METLPALSKLRPAQFLTSQRGRPGSIEPDPRGALRPQWINRPGLSAPPTTGRRGEVSAGWRSRAQGSGLGAPHEGRRAQARGGVRTHYLDEVLLQQGSVHAPGDVPGQLQRAVPAADPPAAPQAEGARRGAGGRPAHREQQKQAEAHTASRTAHAQPGESRRSREPPAALLPAPAPDVGPGPAHPGAPRPAPGPLSCGREVSAETGGRSCGAGRGSRSDPRGLRSPRRLLLGRFAV